MVLGMGEVRWIRGGWYWVWVRVGGIWVRLEMGLEMVGVPYPLSILMFGFDGYCCAGLETCVASRAEEGGGRVNVRPLLVADEVLIYSLYHCLLVSSKHSLPTFHLAIT